MPKANPIHVTPDLIAAFWKYVNKGGPDECWDWTGVPTADGYGQLRWDGKLLSAHRVSFAIHYWEPPVDLEVCHTCDRPPCCNPAHLFQGTHKENHEDSAHKGRRVGTVRSGAIPFDEQLRIVERMKAGESDAVLAEETGRTLQAMQGLRRDHFRYIGIPLSNTVPRQRRDYR